MSSTTASWSPKPGTLNQLRFTSQVTEPKLPVCVSSNETSSVMLNAVVSALNAKDTEPSPGGVKSALAATVDCTAPGGASGTPTAVPPTAPPVNWELAGGRSIYGEGLRLERFVLPRLAQRGLHRFHRLGDRAQAIVGCLDGLDAVRHRVEQVRHVGGRGCSATMR
jgi:hypothetical protein